MTLRNDAINTVKATNTATLIVLAQPEREFLTLWNAGTVTAYLGVGTAVTTANGYPLPGTMEHNWRGPCSVYAITAGGTATISYHYSA